MKKRFSFASLMLLILAVSITSCGNDTPAKNQELSYESDDAVKTEIPKPALPENLEFTPTSLNLTAVNSKTEEGECSGPGRIETSYKISFVTQRTGPGKIEVVEVSESDGCTDSDKGKIALANYKLLKAANIADIVITYEKQDAPYVPVNITIKERMVAGKDGKAGTFEPAVTIYKQ